MPELIDPSEIMFTPFEPKTKNRYIMYIEGIPAYLIKTANRPTITFETIELDHINVRRYVKGKGAWDTVEDSYENIESVRDQLENNIEGKEQIYWISRLGKQQKPKKELIICCKQANL